MAAYVAIIRSIRRELWGVTKAADQFYREELVVFHGDSRATICWCEKS